jgi:hypothetical protein
MAEPYISELFVGREEHLKRITEWINTPDPPQRVLSVVGPPGVGKSYLLNFVREQLIFGEQLVFWIDLSRDPKARGESPDVLDADSMRAWLNSAFELARQKCARVRQYDTNVSADALLSLLITDLCENCDPDLKPIFMVDNFEDISARQRDWFEKAWLEPIISRPCTRIIIGRQDEFSMTLSALRWTEDKLDLTVFTEGAGTQQLATRLTNRPKSPHLAPLPKTLTPDSLLKQIPPYQWNYPGINSVLLERVVARSQDGKPSSLETEDLDQCIRQVTGIPESVFPPSFNLLVKLVTQLPEQWTTIDLDKRQIADEDPLLAELFERGIVVNVPNTPTYQVAAGIRELVQAWYNLSHPNPPE